MSVGEALSFAAIFFISCLRCKIEATLDEMLELISLQDMADRPERGFCGGERQRLAPAQVNYPDLLILYEPAAAWRYDRTIGTGTRGPALGSWAEDG
jgi:ABC-2 type transport system ATP-binding protein